MLDYVSKKSKRKDYDDNMQKYKHELKVPYYMLFVPEEQELTLYRHTGERYLSLTPDGQGRYPIAELDLAIGLHDGWVRYWYQGKLLPLPADLQQSLAEAQRQLAEIRQCVEAADLCAETAERRAETARQARLEMEQQLSHLRTQLEQMRVREGKGT